MKAKESAADCGKGNGEKKGGFSMMKLSERDRNFAVAAIVVLALALVAYVLISSAPNDTPSDGSEFYYLLSDAKTVGFLYDVRGAGDAQKPAIYQCGVDIIGRGRFVGKEIINIACDESGCLATSTEKNGSEEMGFDAARRKFSGTPYILITHGENGYRFFKRRMEIYIGAAGGNVTCDISATES